MRSDPTHKVYIVLSIILVGLIFIKLLHTQSKPSENQYDTQSIIKGALYNGLKLDGQDSQNDIQLRVAEDEEVLREKEHLAGEEAEPDPVEVVEGVVTESKKTEEEFSVDERGFWQGLGATRGHIFDETLAQSILQFFKNVSASSILELGAGTGTYAKLLMSEGIFISCYDGNPNTQELSEGRCGMIDLSKEVDFCKHEWVLSLEVGEHIPKEFESTYIANLNKGNRKGLILSWAVVGQGGTAHVNNQNNDYVRAKFYELGYTSDTETENVFRSKATYGWFKNTIMVFRKSESP